MYRDSGEEVFSTVRGNRRISVVLPRKNWIVCLDGKPMIVRSELAYVDSRYKYVRNFYSSKGTADKRARELNELFRTDRFAVVEM